MYWSDWKIPFLFWIQNQWRTRASRNLLASTIVTIASFKIYLHLQNPLPNPSLMVLLLFSCFLTFFTSFFNHTLLFLFSPQMNTKHRFNPDEASFRKITMILFLSFLLLPTSILQSVLLVFYSLIIAFHFSFHLWVKYVIRFLGQISPENNQPVNVEETLIRNEVPQFFDNRARSKCFHLCFTSTDFIIIIVIVVVVISIIVISELLWLFDY